MEAIVPENEGERLTELYALGLLETAPDQGLNGLCALACDRFHVPIAAISLIDRDRQWFKAIRGLSVTQTPRAFAFCAHTILSDAVLTVPDALSDERFRDNPFVTGEPFIRFYAGAPLVLPSGHRLGSFCLIDRTPRTLAGPDQGMLESFATVVVSKFLRSRPA